MHECRGHEMMVSAWYLGPKDEANAVLLAVTKLQQSVVEGMYLGEILVSRAVTLDGGRPAVLAEALAYHVG